VEPFLVTSPAAPTPVVVEVPHAGLLLPPEIAAELLIPASDALRDADPFVDRLVEGTSSCGATRLVATLSRYVIDLNRAPDDVGREVVRDHPAPRPTQPRGVVWATSTDGRALWRSPLDHARLTDRLARYYEPYHAALAELIERLHGRHGRVILLCVHSMPSTARGARRADVVPGTRGRTTAASRVIDAVEAHFKEHHLSVRHDDPYRGGHTTGLWGRPAEGIHAVQIEVSRALYLDERTLVPLERGIAEIAGVLDRLVERLADVRLP
jgi:N-formylglutamate deformylase